jgi:hypothetical protein
VHHFQRHGANNTAGKLLLLDEAEAKVIRPRIIEQVERERYRQYNTSMICMICKKLGGTRDLRAHIKKECIFFLLLSWYFIDYLDLVMTNPILHAMM